MEKEFRAVLVLYHGYEIPENIVGRISKEVATWCESDISKISIRTCNENDLSKLILKTIKFDDAKEKCKNGDNAVVILSRYIDLNTSVPLFVVNLSTRLMRMLDRKNTIGLTESDKELLEALVVLGRGSIRSTSISSKYHYTVEKDKALREIYNRIFDKDGKIKE